MPKGGEPNRLSDLDLAARCAKRPVDEAAWRELWGRFYALVSWRAARMSGNAQQDELQEIAQEVFLKLFSVLGGYRGEKGSLASYVSTVTASVVLDRWRRANARVRTESFADEVRAAAPLFTTAPVDMEGLLESVRTELSQVESPIKLAVFKALMDGKDIAEICAEHQLKPSYVYQARKECIERVRTAVARLRPEENSFPE